jgi:hypothetical protein
MLNFSVVQFKSICLPSPCGRLSRPRTTTEALPPDRLVGMDSYDFGYVNRIIRASTVLPFGILLDPASLVSLITLKRFLLDST